MKNKFDNSQVAIAKLIMDNLNGSKYEISFTPNGNLMFKRILDNEHFVISKYNDMYFIRRYAYHLDRCYRICPSSYTKYPATIHNGYVYNSYTVKNFGWPTFDGALTVFVKFIEKNR
jgi:hypothetical protein